MAEETEVKLLGGRQRRVKNKTAASIQISSEQIIREAREREEGEIRAPKQRITDAAELGDYRLRKRKEFEDLIRRNKSVWVKYARWEESQKDFGRARSVWERALEVDYRDHSLWLKYADFEMKNKCINHARNIWDRATEYLPRVDQLWHKYIHMEEMLGNVGGARQIFERWMKWMPDLQAWVSYINFELRYNEVQRGRHIFERLVLCHPNEASAWIKFAKFEMKNGETARARSCYERAVSHPDFYDQDTAQQLFLAFAAFEEKCNETERARCIYKYALDHIPNPNPTQLYNNFLAFEKQYGHPQPIEDAILTKRRFQYEDEVTKNPLNYDVWFDYIELEKSCGNRERIEDLYERSIANLPPLEEKRYWQRYIYLWINYVLYEELDVQNLDRTRAIYTLCLETIPHRKFSFSKIWLMAAQFEIRQLDIDRARKILGSAIGKAPKDKIFQKYIEIELQLGNIDRCRKLYGKYLELSPMNSYAWIKYAELERLLSETDRSRALFECAIEQPALDMPELLWKAYIDFEISESEYERTRALYERLLKRTKNMKLWISYAKFEVSSELGEGEYKRKCCCLERARAVFERADCYFRTCAPELKEERATLLEEWLNMETNFGDVDLVRAKLPKKLKKRRHIETEYEEEYIDYLFPEETQTTNLKILEAAYKWKKQKKSSDDD